MDGPCEAVNLFAKCTSTNEGTHYRSCCRRFQSQVDGPSQRKHNVIRSVGQKQARQGRQNDCPVVAFQSPEYPEHRYRERARPDSD